LRRKKDLFIDPNLRSSLEKLAEKYKKSMFVDRKKRSMFTVEMKDNYSIDAFVKDRNLLQIDIKNLIGDETKIGLFINPTSIALDVRNSKLNKYLATSKALKILHAQEEDKFVAVGDNKFDSEMAEESFNQGYKNTTFVYVGTDKFDKKVDFPVYFSKEKYTAGFVEFLNEYGLF